MRKEDPAEAGEEPLVDKTEALPLRSKRLERLKKKQEKKLYKSSEPKHLLDLPEELLLDILTLLRPSDVFVFSRTSRSTHSFVQHHESVLAKRIIAIRYAVLAQCFRLPKQLKDIDPSLHAALQSPSRRALLGLHRKPYAHIAAPDAAQLCTCLTCVLRWNALNAALDFAHWQAHLDGGTPLPAIARGTSPAWNAALTARHAARVTAALASPLRHAALLQTHLASTARALARHAANKGDRRPRFRMSAAEARAGSDAFLERSGPPTVDVPFHRDNYYLLQAFLPNRAWNGDERRWMYVPESQHDVDVALVVKWVERRREEERVEGRLERVKEEAEDAVMLKSETDIHQMHDLTLKT